MKRRIRLLMYLAIAFFMIGMLPVFANAENAGEYTAGSLDELKSAVAQINENSSTATITLNADIALDAEGLMFTAGDTTILGAGHELKLDSMITGKGITVKGDASLSLGKKNYTETLTITGNSCMGMQHPAIIVGTDDGSSGASLSMYSGVTLKDYGAGASGGAGGVMVYADAAFDMYGGTIENCSYGAGSAGGVTVYGTFTLSGGTISKCSGGQGGGVAVLNTGKMNFTKGKISECSSTASGGGVYVGATGSDMTGTSFTTSGGTVEKCTASRSGGGVYVCAGTMNMFNTRVQDCTSGEHGGGVAIFGKGRTAEIKSCRISGCIAGNTSVEKGYGGAVWTQGSTVSVSNSVLTENMSEFFGGGIANVGGTVTVTNSAIYGNTASKKGDDIFTYCPVESLPATLKLCDILMGYQLGEADITGWYEDGANTLGTAGSPLRWGDDYNEGYYSTLISSGDSSLTEKGTMLALKAAYDKNSDILSIKVNSKTHKIDYLQNEPLDVTRLTILVTYTDGTSETVPVTEDMVSGFDSSEHGLNQKLIITYEGYQCYYYVHIMNWTVRVYKMGVDGTYPDEYTVNRCGVAGNGWSMKTTYGTGQYAVEGFTRDEELSIVSGKIDRNNPYAIMKVYLDRNKYKLVFNDEDGTIYSEELVYYEAPVSAPKNDPYKEGFEFVDWGDLVDKMPAQDITYTAQWRESIEEDLPPKEDDPTDDPTDDPVDDPTDDPTDDPVDDPTDDPTGGPVDEPTDDPTDDSTRDPAETPEDTAATGDHMNLMALAVLAGLMIVIMAAAIGSNSLVRRNR